METDGGDFLLGTRVPVRSPGGVVHPSGECGGRLWGTRGWYSLLDQRAMGIVRNDDGTSVWNQAIALEIAGVARRGLLR